MENTMTRQEMQNLLNALYDKGMSKEDAISVLLATLGVSWKGGNQHD